MDSLLVKELIKVTTNGDYLKEVPISTKVAEQLKRGTKNTFCQNEVPYKALIPGYKLNQRMDLVCFCDGELELLEFKLFDQEKVNINFSVKNAIRLVTEDIDKLNDLDNFRDGKEYPASLATLTFVCAVYNFNKPGDSSY